MKILEAYACLGLEDPSKYSGGVRDSSGRILRSGKTTRIAIEMVLDICACKDPNTLFLMLGAHSECENLHSIAWDFLNNLAPSKLPYLSCAHLHSEEQLRSLVKRGRSNFFVYRDIIDQRIGNPPLCYARKVIPFVDSSCRILDRDDITISGGSFTDFFSFVRLHAMCVDNVVTGDRIWSQRHCWKIN